MCCKCKCCCCNKPALTPWRDIKIGQWYRSLNGDNTMVKIGESRGRHIKGMFVGEVTDTVYRPGDLREVVDPS